ncbi:MAG TPA: hypothetical protein PKE26_10675 [Kiritimatiellia bacterium]|nr:hypothetical protein [Kiritimatiellia bacterium]HMO99562.1 hypothetical protein [Kiritimatiellia bacterium]
MNEPQGNKGPPIIPCSLSAKAKRLIAEYAEDLKAAAHAIGNHGLNEEEFRDAGIFRAAVERLRGQQAATMDEKRAFVEAVLDKLKAKKLIEEWAFEGAGDRHDYRVTMPGGWISIIETKGCLDGNNTTIFERPANADEFVIWSLCQNPGADPRHNAWSGIHTRLSAEIVAKGKLVDGLVIWDMLCGTVGRPCPKISGMKRKLVRLKRRIVPPPCIYLFPRSIPDPRNNPRPPCHTLRDVRLLHALHLAFGGHDEEVIAVTMEARLGENGVERKTSFHRADQELASSDWTDIRRARG